MKTPNKLARYWINQPSTLQPDHAFHGQRVFANPSAEEGPICDCWFADGATESARMFKLSLSAGWPQSHNEALRAALVTCQNRIGELMPDRTFEIDPAWLQAYNLLKPQ